MPVISADCTDPGSMSQRRSTARPSSRFHQSAFVRGVHGEREQAGGDEHEHDAGDAEELARG